MKDTPLNHPDSQVAAPNILNFSEGLQVVRDKVVELLEKQSQVLVAINGAGPSVGKSTLAGEIAKGLLVQGVPVGVCLDPDNLDVALTQQKFYQEYFGRQRSGVFVLEGMEPPHGRRLFGNIDLRDVYDGVIRRGAKKFGAPLDKVDVWVALYSEHTRFDRVTPWWDQPYDPFEDVIIRNEHARPKHSLHSL